MNIPKVLLLSYFSICSLALWSQVSIEWSAELNDGLFFYDAIRFNGKYFTARVNTNGFAGSTKNKTALAVYSEDFQMEQASELRIKVGKDKAEFLNFLVLQDQLYAFLKVPDRQTSLDDYVLSKLDTATLEFSTDYHHIFDSNHILGYKNYQQTFAFSPQKRLFLFMRSIKNRETYEQFVKVKMLNYNGQILLDTLYSLGTISKNVRFTNAEIDDAGNFHFIGYTTNSLVGVRNTRENYLGRFSMENQYFQWQKFYALPNYKFAEMMVAGNSHQICVGGFYRGDDSNDFLRRPVIGTVDINSKDTVKLLFHDLPPNDIGLVSNEERWKARKPNRSVNGEWIFIPIMRDILFWNNQIVLISENYSSGVIDHSSPLEPTGPGDEQYVFGLGDIKIWTYSQEGEPIWKSVVRNTHSLNSNAFNPRFSYYLSRHPDELRILIDNITNEKFDKGVLLARVDTTGEVEYQSFNSYTSQGIFFSPLHTRQLSESEYFVTGRKGFTYKYGLLKIE